MLCLLIFIPFGYKHTDFKSKFLYMPVNNIMNNNLKPKKKLGQHFLIDKIVVEKIINNIKKSCSSKIILEIGPGKGVLTQDLYSIYKDNLHMIDIDIDMINLLKTKFKKNKSTISPNIIHDDFLKYNLSKLSHNNHIDIVGNFPYNISSQIFYKILEHKDIVCNVVCMVQKEVGKRITSPPGSKNYGIPSVLIQAFYKTEYLFDVAPTAFDPPPKVVSSVIRLQRDFSKKLSCDESQFKKIVKIAFNQRRKTLRNALKPILTNMRVLKTPDFIGKNSFKIYKKLSHNKGSNSSNIDTKKPYIDGFITKTLSTHNNEKQDYQHLHRSFTEEFDDLLGKRAEQLSVQDFEYLVLKLTN